MRADRLLSILMLLQTKGRMTAHDLAEQLEVSERTIYRDMEALSMAGVPVYAERGPGGGCALVDGYQTRLTGLTETEVQALYLLNITRPLADLGLSRALDDAMLKLTAALPQSSREHAEFVRQRLYVDTTWWYHADEATSCLQTLQEALWHDHKLIIFYHEDDGAWSERLAEPYGLVSKAGVWYLIASCHDEKCVFRVTRIHHATPSDEAFIRQKDFDLANYWANYCAHIETNRPDYAPSLRPAPDEAERLPQLLLDCGYMLVENDEPVPEKDTQANSHHPQQPKATLHSSPTTTQQNKKTPSRYARTRSQHKKKSVPPSQKNASGLPKKTKKTNIAQRIKKTFLLHSHNLSSLHVVVYNTVTAMTSTSLTA
jgi:predicted DNA-binding transcriptional regulator YafY